MSDSFSLPTRWHPANFSAGLSDALGGGVAHEGRLRRLAQALLRGARGEGLLVAGVGSSMMADFGGVVGATQTRFALGHMGTALTCRGSCVKTGWLFPLMAMLREQVAALRRTAARCGRASASATPRASSA